jgi:hypothetical protein
MQSLLFVQSKLTYLQVMLGYESVQKINQHILHKGKKLTKADRRIHVGPL